MFLKPKKKVLADDESDKKKKRLANIRLFASAYSELYYIFQNFVDHMIDFGESNLLGQKYLPTRLKEYKGQKKIAFLYHGYFQGTVGYERIERLLESELFNIFAISGTYQPYSQDIRKSAAYEMKVLEWVLQNTDAEEVYLIGHSQGGIVARYMLQFLDAHRYVNKAIFLSTPHQGTKAAYGGWVNKLSMNALGMMIPGFPKIQGESAEQLKPNGHFIRLLNSRNLPPGVEYTSIYTYIDPVVWPSSNARLPYREANNILIRKIGHMQTMYDFNAIELILKALMLPNHHWAKAEISKDQIFEKRHIEQYDNDFDEIVTY